MVVVGLPYARPMNLLRRPADGTLLALFDDEFLKKLEYLNILSKRLFAGHFRAERRTRKHGTGLEFADYRPYVSGDDFRHLDWKAFLRLNKLIMKLFEEEEDLPIYFFVDCSQSMPAISEAQPDMPT